MCLPFLCGDREYQRSSANNDIQPWQATPPPPPPPSHRGDDGYRRYEPVISSSPHRGANLEYGVGNNFRPADAAAQGRAAGVNTNGGSGAASYNSDSDDMPAPVGFVRGTIAMPQTPPRNEPIKTVVPALTTSSGAPGKKGPNMVANTYVDAGAWHHYGPVTASQPNEGATETTQRAPVPQVARRDDHDDATTAASRFSRWR